MAIEVSKRLFTVHDYHRMVDAGILHEDDRVELIRGEVVAMNPIGPRHITYPLLLFCLDHPASERECAAVALPF